MPAVLPQASDANTLYVIDISGYVFRAYHALPPLNNPAGEPTHAVLGVTTMLQKLFTERSPVFAAVALDSPARSFRKDRYSGYKANRPAAPPDLSQQILRVKEVLEAYRLPCFQVEGMEADDVIATLVGHARQHGLRVVIVSSDKDLMQLVTADVLMYDTMREALFGPEEVEKKLGIGPAHVRDYLALVGDSSDNIPGVASVGPKTAVQLLLEHGSLDGLYAALDKIQRQALREKLEAHREDAFLSRELVTLKHDVVIDAGRERLLRPDPDYARLRALYKELDFSRLLAQIGAGEELQVATVAAAKPPEPVTQVILERAQLDALAAALENAKQGVVFTLLEGPHPVSGQLVGAAFAWQDGSAYVPVGHAYLGCPAQLPAGVFVERLAPWLASARHAKACADAKKELMALRSVGIELAGVEFDTMLASYLIDPEKHGHGLDEIARFELKGEVDAATADLLERHRVSGELASLPIEMAAERAGRLARLVIAARAVLEPRLEAARCTVLLRDMELPLARVLAGVELTGVRVDPAHLTKLSHTVSEQLSKLDQKCKELAGRDFNVGSPRQLEAILFDELKLPVVKRTKTARSTDHTVLEELAALHELPATILEQRMLAKLRSTYLEALPREINAKTGRIHTDFRQAVAATGRLSSTEPNLQNIPIRSEIGRSIRDAFVAREGWRIMSADYSQIELRVLAHISGDKELTQAFREHADVHDRTARAIFGVDDSRVTREQRAQAKTVNYAVIYGQTQFALARNLRIERSRAAQYIKAFFQQYSGVASYMEKIVAEATEHGEVRTLSGRIRKLPELRSADRVARQAAERVARNTPIQGSAADIIKLAMIKIHDELVRRKLQAKMLLTVHDELVFEAPSDEQVELEALVRDHMEHVMKLDVPLVVDAGWGPTWGQAH